MEKIRAVKYGRPNLTKMKKYKHIIILSGISLLTILIFISGRVTELFQFDRHAIANLQFWRLLTGHFTHWNLSHLFWDLVAFIIATIAIFRIGEGKKILPLIMCSSIFISIWVFVLDTHINLYRGLSGIDTAFFVFLCIEMIIQSLKENDKKRLLCFSALSLTIIVKTFYELLTGNIIFANSGNFIPLFSSHLSGIIAAIFFIIASKNNLFKTIPSVQEEEK